MKLLVAAILAAGTTYGAIELSETIVPDASAHTAFVQGKLIADRAFIEWELGAENWESALRTSVDSTRGNDGQLTLDGTTLRWDNGIDVWCISLPDYNSTVDPVVCDGE